MPTRSDSSTSKGASSRKNSELPQKKLVSESPRTIRRPSALVTINKFNKLDYIFKLTTAFLKALDDQK